MMIQISPQRIILTGRDGGSTSISLHELERRLDEALVQCGIQGSWLVDHLVVALQDYVAVMDRGGETWDEQSLQLTLAQMLADAGYADVAACFADKVHGQPAIAGPEGKAAWHLNRVQEVLQRRLKTMPQLVPRLAEKVVDKLARMALKQVGDNLIVEIARHLLAEWGEKERGGDQGELAGREDWLATAGFWQTFLPADRARLVTDEILEIKPLSELLPVVRVRLSVPDLVERNSEKPLTDLTLMSLLAQTLGQVAETIENLVEQLRRRFDNIYVHPAHLSVAGLDEMLAAEFSAEGRNRRLRHRQEIVSFMADTLKKQLQHRLILTFTGIQN